MKARGHDTTTPNHPDAALETKPPTHVIMENLGKISAFGKNIS